MGLREREKNPMRGATQNLMCSITAFNMMDNEVTPPQHYGNESAHFLLPRAFTRLFVETWLGIKRVTGEYLLLLYLLDSTRAAIGQFSGPYSTVRPA